VPKDDPARKAWWRRAILTTPSLDGLFQGLNGAILPVIFEFSANGVGVR